MQNYVVVLFCFLNNFIFLKNNVAPFIKSQACDYQSQFKKF